MGAKQEIAETRIPALNAYMKVPAAMSPWCLSGQGIARGHELENEHYSEAHMVLSSILKGLAGESQGTYPGPRSWVTKVTLEEFLSSPSSRNICAWL